MRMRTAMRSMSGSDSPKTFRQDPSQVEKLRLARQRSAGAPVLVPLGNVVRYDMTTTPSEIDRQDLTRQVVISANLDGLPLGTAVNKCRRQPKRFKWLRDIGSYSPGVGRYGGILRLYGRSACPGDHPGIPHPRGPV